MLEKCGRRKGGDYSVVHAFFILLGGGVVVVARFFHQPKYK